MSLSLRGAMLSSNTDKLQSSRVKEYYPIMNTMRYVMALGVVISHFNLLCGADIYFPISSYNCVGGFFALSGFLIVHTYRPNDFAGFVKRRAYRILPSYIQVVILAAVLLYNFSKYDPLEYFINIGFWKYIAANLSFLNWLHPDLPGVFSDESFKSSAVNGSLWTMKVEWLLYLSVPIFVWLTTRFSLRTNPFYIFIIIFSIGWKILFDWMYACTEEEIYTILGRQVFGQLSFFYMGALLHTFRQTIHRYHIIIITVSIILLLTCDGLPYFTSILGAPLVSIIVIGISMTTYFPTVLHNHQNISYEIYLSHWPILQILVALNLQTLPHYVLIGISIISIIAVSVGIHAVSQLVLPKKNI